jgi:ABC-type phosphate/phosphonate transport system substrate-binding protein
MSKSIQFALLVLGAGLLGPFADAASADEGPHAKADLNAQWPPQVARPAGGAGPADSVLRLTAPPRETRAEGEARFGPLAEYLSKVLRKRVVYEHPTTWGAYQAFMIKGTHDLVFDAPHFTGWRVAALHYSALLKVPGEYVYTVFVRKADTAVTDVAQLRGLPVCGHEPPHLGTLLLFSAFDNPLRQPLLIATHGYDHVYERVLAGECRAGVLSTSNLKKFDKDRTQTRVIHQYRALPRYALSASPRVSAEDRARIVEALGTPAGVAAMAGLAQPYGIKNLIPARNEEYAELGSYLKNEWGFH